MILYRGIHKYIGNSIYYASQPKLKFGLFNNYIMCKSLDSCLFYKRRSKYTKVINLLEDYVQNIKKNTMYEYRRAKKEECYSSVISDLGLYRSFFGKFNLEKRNQENITLYELEINKENMIIRGAYNKENELLVTHCYLIDKELRTVILHTSSSIIYSDIDSHKRDEVGRANRMLHIDDMVYFKSNGFICYDMGGYAYNSSDRQLIGINNFKDSFGGELIEMSNYDNWLLIFAIRVKEMIKKVLK